ncbi:Threonyl/alanyl tRNA synthetase [Rhodofomes roseus]|uniref:Threonyl/alanyl tRNA synthetase n=1 Tax=Rhodofomes roseus TaxID=34475 RepID=A0ABQ8KUU6_9APHY|nr:Threonyl/alanyl tRNA synthetase [Rhodofomes roseus]KAH9842052.1 Threonyl/alanyl tRNA synthetase [Rhodofomes roseus]
MPDDSKRKGTSWETSPMDIAKEISNGLADRVVSAKLNGDVWDLERPLEGSCTLELLDFQHPEGKHVFWHSSAHSLGETAERHYGCHLCIVLPPRTMASSMKWRWKTGMAVQNSDYSALEKLSDMAVKEKQKFERILVSKEKLLEMFGYNRYKKYSIETKIPDGGATTVYRCGPMINLCVGPHIPHTGKIKVFMVTKNSASYFLGDPNNDSLQRVYGISFPDKKQMAEYKVFLAEAARIRQSLPVVLDAFLQGLEPMQLLDWADRTASNLYQSEVRKLSRLDELHFVANAASPEKLETFTIRQLAVTMETHAPRLWCLFDVLLDADDELAKRRENRRVKRRASRMEDPAKRCALVDTDDADLDDEEEVYWAEIESHAK